MEWTSFLRGKHSLELATMFSLKLHCFVIITNFRGLKGVCLVCTSLFVDSHVYECICACLFRSFSIELDVFIVLLVTKPETTFAYKVFDENTLRINSRK